MQNILKKLKNNPVIIKIINFFDPKKISFYPDFQKRAYIMGGISAALIVFILIRYAWISFFPTQLREQLLSAGTKQFESSMTLTQHRATMTDRNGHPLAISVPTTSIYLLAKKMPKDVKVLRGVAKQLSLPSDTLVHYASQKKKFIWLKRQLNHTEMEKIGSLKQWYDFIGTVEEPKRIYPEKDLAAQLIGFVGADGNGLEGLEKVYNERLKAIPTKTEVRRDARGKYVIPTPSLASKPDQLAKNFALSIDIVIQSLTQDALHKGVLNAKAVGGSAIVMDIQTGEILAIASYPTYDLNNPPEGKPEARRFRPVMDAIELGSVVKPMFMAKALDLQLITPNSKIFVEMGKMPIQGGVLHDTHKNGWLTPEEILKFSSNIGIYKIMQKMGRQTFYETLMEVGFGTAPGTKLPGEWGGRIAPVKNWSEMRFANMTFGQGFAISPLQLAHALCIIAGGGIDRGVHLLKEEQDDISAIDNSKRFISEAVSKKIIKMLESVTEEPDGTGTPARIPGVLVAGKTGTSQIWSQTTKSYSERTLVFEGVIPARSPLIAIVVVLDQAKARPASGGLLAGPVFAEIGKKTLNYLHSRGLFSMDTYKNLYLKKADNDSKQIIP